MAEEKLSKIHIGTAGWSYKDWVPSFYPKAQTKEFDWLQFYAQYFNVVEVNSSYYTYLNPNVVKAWLNKVDGCDDFLFTLKLHQDFTHKKNYTKEQTLSVRNNLDMLRKAERLGGLLIQFPYSFAFNQPNVSYIKKLKDIFDDMDNFIEVRHSSWNNNEALEFFKTNNLSLCTIDQPQIGQSIPFKPIITNDKAYIRFHGRNVKAWKESITNFGKPQTYEQQSGRYSYLYSPGEMVEISQQIKEVFDRVKKIFVIMNNHPKGDAVANAFELLHYLKELSKVKIPSTTVKAYPRLEKIILQ